MLMTRTLVEKLADDPDTIELFVAQPVTDPAEPADDRSAQDPIVVTGPVAAQPVPAPPVMARPIAAAAPGRRGVPGAGLWWEAAKTVVVTRVTGPRQLETVPRLVVPVGDRQLAFRICSGSPEAEQLACDGRVLVQPGDRLGKPALGSHQRQGHAQIVTAGTLLSYVQSAIEAKYRWRVPLLRYAHRMARGGAPYNDVVVLVTVHEPSPIPLPPA
jgi:hypothetical protein